MAVCRPLSRVISGKIKCVDRAGHAFMIPTFNMVMRVVVHHMIIFVTQTSISPTATPVLIVVSGPSASGIAHPEVAAMPAFKNLR